MPSPPPPKRPVETLLVAFEIIEYLKDQNGATLAELADEIDAAKSTVHRHLKTLEYGEYVIQEAGKFYPSLLFLNYGAYARERLLGYELATEKVDDLASETNERSQFIVEEHGKGIYIHTATGDHAVQVDARIGKQSYLHASAAGKAILANLHESRIEELIDSIPLPALTENTITDRESLYEEIETIREQGYSTDTSEIVDGVRALSVPITSPDDVMGAITVGGPVNRMSGEWFNTELPELLLQSSNLIELNLTHS
jgi:DNA-binding IclR family transcriptional regulator